MSAKDSVNLEKLQNCELIIAEELKRICEKHDIKFFLVCGSMLGAVRHKGFIPWDDDMDFGMLWDDYIRFVEVCSSELGNDFVLLNWDADRTFPFSYSKIILNGTLVHEDFAPDNKKSGIFIDIFPFHCVPLSIKEQRKQKWKVFIYRRVLWLKQGYGKILKKQSIKQFFKYYIAYAMSLLLGYEQTKKNLGDILTKFNHEKSDYLFMDSDYDYYKNSVKREWVEHLEQYEFDGLFLPGIKDYDAYLRHLYGDYMVLPKVEDRVNHDIARVEFGNYS